MSTGSGPAVISALVAQAQQNESVEDSAAVIINGIAQRITDAVNAAIANGATADQLAPLTQVVTDLQTHSAALSAAVAANTPAA
jgi:hypothetical protein